MRSEEQYETIDQYIALHAPAVQKVLEKVRQAARKGAPDAEEVISYRMPALKQKGILVYFAAWQSHIGLYPPIRGDEELVQACAPFAGPKGNLQFPLDKAIPYRLITRIVKHRLAQCTAKKSKFTVTAKKASTKKASPKKATAKKTNTKKTTPKKTSAKKTSTKKVQARRKLAE